MLSLCASSGNGWAWGATGHQIVCEIAYRLAEPDTRSKIRKLMQGDKDYDYYYQSCVWADKPAQIDARADEHFVNVPRNAKGLSERDPCPVKSPCVLSAIKKDWEVLASKAATQKEKLQALKYLGHWVGDLHQPLHVSFQDDRGGNYVDVDYAGELKIEDCKQKMHAAWDTCLVLALLGNDVEDAATELMKGITPANIERWTEDTQPIDWASESFRITVDPKTKYCNRVAQTCEKPTATVFIDKDYVSANGPIIKERLQKAGVRLAHLLDEALSK